MLMSLFYAASALLIFGGVGTALPLDKFYPFGKIHDDDLLKPSDDGFSDPVHLNPSFPFFNSKHTKLFVNNNGILSFNKQFEKMIPQKFPIKGYPLIAPFWADVDTTGEEGGEVWYRITADKSLLTRAKNDITTAFYNDPVFEPETLFIATWYKVGYYRNQTRLSNTFQCILVTNGTTSFAIFHYATDMIQWTTGDASGGRCGLGGAAAQVGVNAGDGVKFEIVPESWTPEIINIDSTSNVNIPGVWIFRVDEDFELPPPPTPPPTTPPPTIPPPCMECVNDLSVTFAVEPRSGSLLGGTAIHLLGPCFTECDIIECVFEEKQNVPGIVLNRHTAMCISPRFRSDGWKKLTLYIERNGQEKELGPREFYSVFPHNTSDITIGQHNSAIMLEESKENFTVHWDPHSLLPRLDSSSFMVNIELHELEFENKEWRPFLDFTITRPNSGNANFSVPVSNRAEIDVYAVAIRLSVGSPSEQANTYVDILKFAEGNVSHWKTDLFHAKSLDLFNRCMEWHEEEDSFDIRTTMHEHVPCCSETKPKADAMNSGFVQDYRDELVALLHPSADSCYLQETLTSDNSTLGQKCCYDNSTEYLITGPDSGGTVHLFSPLGHSDYDMYLQHIIEDVIPAIHCCSGVHKLATCRLYYERRESKVNETCKLPPTGMTTGDPHIVTMDNFTYTFNGLGEFVLIETIKDIFTLQCRLEQFTDRNGDLISTSYYSAIVAKQFDSDTVQFQLAYNKQEIDALINGEMLDFKDLPEQQFNNVILKKSANAMSAIFSSGVHIEVKAAHEAIFSLFISLPNNSYYWSQTSGLMGNYNGDESDDLLPRGGTVPISHTSSTKKIHENFGITWIISRPEDSLFTYGKGEDWSTYYKPDFIPFYSTAFSDPDLEKNASITCGSNKRCLYDIAATGILEIGSDTLKNIMSLKDITDRSKVECIPGCANGVCVDKNTCSCSQGFSGDLCDVLNVKDCEEDFCENGGTCELIGASAVCHCQDGFTGVLCEMETSNTMY